MLKLDEEGFLEQPHTSAGRIPTDRGYRYFVDNLMEHEIPQKKEREIFEEMQKNFQDSSEDLFENFGKEVSRHLNLFCGFAKFGARLHTDGYGFEEVLKEPEFEDREMLLEFGKLVDNLDLLTSNYFERTRRGNPAVFIGEENPIRSARNFGAVSVRFENGNFGKGVIFSIGPKRMNYERASALLDFALKQFIK